ncbi:MAG: tocopherol cyclase family protein [Spirochaetales bacterium]|nr:tocopherol cyclase family protein [Spirochaetales bacterium]
MKTIINPAPFRGNFRKKRYFEGWYLKHVSADCGSIYSFIPGISLSPGDRHSFIQIINGITGETWYAAYPLESFRADRKTFSVEVGDSRFSLEGCRISIDCEGLSIDGELAYSSILEYPRSLTHPGIMGWFSFVPGMECRHDVLSMSHTLSGHLQVNGEHFSYSGGKGYIEKDWGWNFPGVYTWVHCNHFKEEDSSFMLAVASIPLGPVKFTGFLGFFSYDGVQRAFGTWNRWKVRDVSFSDPLNGRILLSGGDESIVCHIHGKPGGPLKAPSGGAMSRVIKESINSEIRLEYTDAGGTTRVFNGSPAAFERRI